MPFACCDLPILGVPMFRMPPSFRSVSSVAFGAHCLMSVKDHAAAWRARPSGPDVWADALVRRISPLLPPRTRAGKEGKKKYGIRLYPRKNVHVSAAHILCFLFYYTTISCVCKSNFRFLYQYIVFSGVIKRPPHHILYLIACIKGFFCSSLLAPKVCIRHASSDLAPPPCSAVFSYHRLV